MGPGKLSIKDWDSTADSIWIIRGNAVANPDVLESARTFRTPTSDALNMMEKRCSVIVVKSLLLSLSVPLTVGIELD